MAEGFDFRGLFFGRSDDFVSSMLDPLQLMVALFKLTEMISEGGVAEKSVLEKW